MPLIRANRESVDDRFSALGFTVRTESPLFEVGIATDPALFRAENRSRRSRRNFFSSRSNGAIVARRGEAAYLVPPDVLANFVGQSKLYFGLATYRENSGGVPDWVQAPTEGHMYVDLSGLTERGLRRLAGRPVSSGAYGGANGHDPSLDWGGDAQARSQPQTPAKGAASGNGKAANGSGKADAAAPAAPYDDGFGEFPAAAPRTGAIAPIVTRPATGSSPAAAAAPASAPTPVAAAVQALARRAAPRPGPVPKTLGANDFNWPPSVGEGNELVKSYLQAYNARIADGFRGQPAPDPTQYSSAGGNTPDSRAREEVLKHQVPRIADDLQSDSGRQEVCQAVLQVAAAVSLQVLDQIRAGLPTSFYQLVLDGDAPPQESRKAVPPGWKYISRRMGTFTAWLDVAIQKASADTAERLNLQKQQWEGMLAMADMGATMFGFVPGAGEIATIVGLIVHSVIQAEMPNFEREYASFDEAMRAVRRAYTRLAAAVLQGLIANALGQKMMLDDAFIHPDVQAFLEDHEANTLLGWEQELSFLGYQPGARAQSLESSDDDDAYGIDGPIPDDDATAQAQELRRSRPLDTPAPEYPGASRFAPAHRSNYRAVTAPREIRQIVIHITDGGSRIAGTIGWFQNPDQRNARNEPIHVSAHYVVGRDGEVVQMVRNNDVAWHANSANGHSIGIEHVANTRGLMPTDDEYRGSAGLVAWLCNCYGLPIDRTHVLGHAEADPHTSHTDCPNAVWDWDHYMDCVRQAAADAAAPAAVAQSLGRSGRVLVSKAQEIITPFYDPADPASALTCQANAFSEAREGWFAGVPDTRIFPHSAICLLEMKDGSGAVSGYGTGFYIGANRILTCGHNVRGAASMDVIPACNDTEEPFGRFNVTSSSWRVPGSYNDGDDFDLAVIDGVPAAPGGVWFDQLEELNQSRPEGVVVCGYSRKSDRVPELTQAMNGRMQHLHAGYIARLRGEVFDYPILTLHRASGSPVYYLSDKDGTMKAYVVGVHISGEIAATQNLNTGCRLTSAKIGWIEGRTATLALSAGQLNLQRPSPRSAQARPMPGRAAHAAASQPLGTESIEYPVQLVPQPNKLACWAASMAMLLSFRRNASLQPETLANDVGGSLVTSYSWDLLQAVRDRYGFTAIDVPSNTSLYFSPVQWAQWLRDLGPLWVVIVGMPHAVVVSGLRGNTADAKACEVKLLNPWDTRVAFDDDAVDFHPANAGYADWISFQQFASDFGNMAEPDYGNWRVLHLPAQAATAQSLSIRTKQGAASRSAGYLAPPPRRVRAASLEDSASADEPIEPSRVPGTRMRRQRGNQGRVTWALDQLEGVKLCDPGAAMVPALAPTTITLDDWPCVGADTVPLPLTVRFDAGGGAVGNVSITAGKAANVGYDASITATIDDEPQLLPGMGAPQAAIKVTIDVDFSGTPNGNVSARTRLRLVGNGRYDLDSAWQH